MKNLKVLFFTVIVFILGCEDKKDKVLIEYNDNGSVQQISIVNRNNKNDSTILIYHEGNVEEMYSPFKTNEHLYFFSNGRLSMKLNKENDTLNGLAISFTKSGSLDFFRYLYKGKNIYDTYFFYDSSTMVKEFIQYAKDSSGDYVHKIYFDRNGAVQTTER